MNFLGMGPMEVIIVLLVAFIFLGPERMVDAARMLGKGMRELRRLSEELPRLDLDEEDLFPSDGRPGRGPSAPAGGGVHSSQSPTDFMQGDGRSPPPEAKGDEPDDEAPVAFSPGASARDTDIGETAEPEEKR